MIEKDLKKFILDYLFIFMQNTLVKNDLKIIIWNVIF
jgi:hypothetical protein